MELFLIYLITRLTDLRDGLESIEVVSGIFLTVCVVVRIAAELFTEAKVKEKPQSEAETDADVFFYHKVRQKTKRGVFMTLPVFVLTFIFHMLLPTTHDAVVIAGGYGLVEAVKNERVQRLFNKSANVASQWLDEQLNGDDKEKAKKEEAAESKDKSEDVSDSAAEKKSSTDKSSDASPGTEATSTKNAISDTVAKVEKAAVTTQKVLDAVSKN